MRIDSLTPRLPGASATKQAAAPERSFADMLNENLQQVNDLQGQADNLVAKVAAGDLESVQAAMVSLEKASLALDLTVQVRNKVLEAYQELMRTQV